MIKHVRSILLALIIMIVFQGFLPGNLFLPVQTAFADMTDGVVDDFSSSTQYESKINDFNEKIIMSVESWYIYPDAIALQANSAGQYWQTDINRDISNSATLVLKLKDSWVSGSEQHWNVVLNDGTDHAVPLASYGEVSDTYQNFSIPLSSFNAQLTDIKYLRFVHNDSTYAQLHADEIKLTGTTNTPTPTNSTTPTNTLTPSNTPTPSSTLIPTNTPTPSNTLIPSNTPNTSDITEWGFVSSSDNNSPEGEDRNKAFDNNTNTKWLIYHPTGWIQYEFQEEEKCTVSSYTLTSANDYDVRDPKDWTLQGSNDGSSWTALDSRVDQNFENRFQTKAYTIDVTKQLPFQYFRIEFTNNHTGGELQVAEIQLLGIKTSSLVNSEINSKWQYFGGQNGFLGSPISNESATSDGIGRFNDYQGGSIYWYPQAGAFEIHGPVKEKWISMGAEASILGYPISDEITTTDSLGKYWIFQNGRIYYHPTYGTHYITGKLYLNWADKGGETGALGYPETDPIAVTGGTTQDFEKGSSSTLDSQIKDSTDLRGEINRRGIAIRNQGSRGTCVPHAIVFLYEYAYTGLLGNKYNHLSIEYSTHASNKATTSTDDPSCFPDMEQGYSQYGTVLDSSWPYNPDLVYDFNAADAQMTPALINEGRHMVQRGLKFKGRYIRKDGPFTEDQLNDIINCLDRGIPVAEAHSGHAMDIVGYVKDASEAGGGHFIIRNSWGPGSGDQGYVTLTFGFFQTTPPELFVMDSLVQ